MKHFSYKVRSLLAHYQSKLLIAFLLCSVFPVLLTGIVAYQISYNIATKQITDAAISSSDQINMQLNARISQAENVSDTLQYSMYTLLQSDKFDKTDYIDTYSNVRNNIYLYKSTFNFHHIYAFLDSNQLGSNEYLYTFPTNQLKNFDISKDELQNIGSSSLWLYKKNLTVPYILNTQFEKVNGVVCCRAQVNQSTGNIDYAFMIVLNSTDFADVLQYAANPSVHTYIVTDGDQVVAKSNDSQAPLLTVHDIQNSLPEKSNYFKKDNTSFYCLTLDNGWYQITEIPEKYIQASTNALLKWILFTLLICIFVTILLVLFIVRSFSGRINHLSSAMNDYQLDSSNQSAQQLTLKRHKELIDYDEIDYLGLSFENMKKSIQNNLDSIVSYKIREERLKYQLLQSQINPHFLYNILGSIQNCQSMGKLDIASQMITDLTKFYRLSLRKSGELILLKDELEIAELYLRIEKLCHSNIIDWTIDLADGIENFAICKFTLQPFLENSILHGISEKTPNIHIDISAEYGDATVIITLKDNGSGIPMDKLQELQNDLSANSIHYDRHFGICNVNGRISNEYYGKGTVTIDSTLGQGTTVIIEYLQIEV